MPIGVDRRIELAGKSQSWLSPTFYIGLGDGYLSDNGNANFAPAARMTLSARELSEETHDWYVGLIDRR